MSLSGFFVLSFISVVFFGIIFGAIDDAPGELGSIGCFCILPVPVSILLIFYLHYLGYSGEASLGISAAYGIAIFFIGTSVVRGINDLKQYEDNKEERRKEKEAQRKKEEARRKEEEERHKKEETLRKEVEERRKEVEARRKELETQCKELEERRKEEEAQRKEEEARRKEEEVRKIKQSWNDNQKKAEQFLKDNYKFISDFILNNELLTTFLCIDSNIWMGDEYKAFWDEIERYLERGNKQLILYGPQFDEICNIKINTGFGETKNRRSRMAISRIDHLSEKNLLRVEPISIDSKPGAYADPLIIKLIQQKAKENSPVCLLTDDKELRVRAREILRVLNTDSKNRVLGAEILRSPCLKIQDLKNYIQYLKEYMPYLKEHNQEEYYVPNKFEMFASFEKFQEMENQKRKLKPRAVKRPSE